VPSFRPWQPSWAPTDDPTVWEFKLREGVKFHGGEDFTADDVVFSLKRAMMPTSAMKELLASVKEVARSTITRCTFRNRRPEPAVPNNLTNLFMMDSGLGEAKNGVKPAGHCQWR
jgi:peptide/nickel transport system substrate-binding protein